MPYIGRELNRGNYLKLDDISSQFNGSLTTFNLTNGGVAFFPGSSLSILVTLNGVLQESGRDFSIDQSQITFVNPPASGVFFSCVVLGLALNFNSVPNNSIGGQQLSLPFTYNQFFHLDNTNNRIGIGTLVPASALDVKGTSTFSGPISVANTISLGDNDKLKFGDGQDLEIYHDGSSYIKSTNAASNLFINSALGLQLRVNSSEAALAATANGSVELFHNGSEKFETTGIGISVVNGISDTATISGPSNLVIDPVVVGNNTGVVRIKGDLFVDGTTTQINSTTLEISDFVVGIASTATTDLLTDGAGIKIGPNNTFLYEHNGGTNPSLKSSENLNVASGKGYQINQTEVLNSTTLGSGVINSSLTSVGTLGSLTVSGDVSIADKIVHTGDTNTSISFPSTDYIRLTTSGSSRLNATPNGYILLGTNSEPSGGDAHSRNARLLVQGRIGNTADSGRLNLQRGSSASNGSSIGSLTFTDNGNNAYARIETLADAAPGTNDYPGRIVFSTTPDGSASPTEKLRITSTGNIGINNIDPGASLDIGGNTDGNIQAILTRGADSNFQLQFRNETSSNDAHTVTGKFGLFRNNDDIVGMRFRRGSGTGAGSLDFTTGGVEKVRITSNGSVGVGTDNPASKLSNSATAVSDGIQSVGSNGLNWQTSNSNAYIAGFENQSTGNGALFRVGDDNSARKILHAMNGSGSTVFLARGDGKVGINSTAPETALDIHSDDGILVKTTTNAPTNGARIQFSDKEDGTQRGHIIYKHPDNSISPGAHEGFLIGGTENTSVVRVEGRALIDEKVGIGTDNPTATLHVRGAQTAGGILLEDSSTATQGPAIQVIAKRSDGNIHHSFSGKLFLAKNRTDAKIQGSDSILGTVAFGGNHTDSSMSNILYAASIHGVAEDSFDSATDMPTALVFRTGSTGRNGNTNNVQLGIERLRITSTGNIGINKTNPGSKLTIAGFNGTGLKLEGSGSDYQGIQLQVTDASATQTRNIFIDAVNETGAAVANQVGQIQSDGGSHWSWSTQAPGNRTDRREERLRITSTGNVAIGTISGLGKLHVRAADECNFVVREESTQLVLSAETNNGRDSNRMMALEGSAYSFTFSGTEKLRIESNGTVNQTAGAFGNNITYGGRTFTANYDMRTTSLRGGVLVRNMNNFRSESDAASFMVYDAYDTSSKTFAFRVSRGATLSDKFWVKTDGSVYAASTFSGNSISLTSNITQTAAAPQHIFKESGSSRGNTTWAIVRDSDNFSIRWDNSPPYAFQASTTVMGAVGSVQLKGGQLMVDDSNRLDAICVYLQTTSGGANVNVDSSGLVRRSTSSAKYKTNVETIEDRYSDALLNCRPVYYRSTCENDNPDYGWWGFIAEEVAEIDPRLVYYKEVDVTLDGKGGKTETPCELEPEGVAYDRFVPHLLNLIKRQKQTIETLESKVDGLLDRITALEGG